MMLNHVPSLNNLLCGEVPNLCLPFFHGSLILFCLPQWERKWMLSLLYPERAIHARYVRFINITWIRVKHHLNRGRGCFFLFRRLLGVCILILSCYKVKVNWNEVTQGELSEGSGCRRDRREARRVKAAVKMKPSMYNTGSTSHWVSRTRN